MTITWLGHSCFRLESAGFRLLIDPYYGVAGYPELHTTAHAVYCSHEHYDHNYREGVTLLPAPENPFTVETLAVWHDPEQGALRGANTIHIFSAEGLRVAHLGDLGHPLSPEQRAQLGRCDAILCPVGGFYTLEPDLLKAELDALSPRCIVPMHYRHDPYGLPAVAPREVFLEQYPASQLRFLDSNRFSLTADTPSAVIVPLYQGLS